MYIFRKLLRHATPIMLTVLVSAACGGTAAPASQGASGGVKTLTIANVETPQGFDKDFFQSAASSEAVFNVVATLTRFDVRTGANGVKEDDYSKPIGGLAESWTVSPDGLVYTFKMRQGVKSHFGNLLTANDVKWTFDRSFATKGLGVNSLGLGEFLDPTGVEAVDASTVKFTMKRSNPTFLVMVGTPVSGILDSTEAQKHVTDQDPWAKDWLARTGASFGPYKVESFTAGQEAVFAAHDGYYLGAPPIKRIIYKAVPDSSSREALLETGAVDVSEQLTPLQMDQAKSKPGISIVSTPGSVFIALMLNQTQPPFNKPQVRQAMAFAAPYDAITSTVYRGWGASWKSVIAANQPGASDQYWPYKTDLERAKTLLASAGYPNGFDMTITSNAEVPAGQEMGILYRTNLESIGIHAQLENLPAAAYTDKRMHSNFQGMMWQAQAYVPDIGYSMNIYFRVDATPNWGKFNDPDIDQSIAKGLSLTGAERQDYFSKLQKPIVEATPWVSLAQPGFQFASRSNVQGLVYNNANVISFAALDKK